MEWIIMHLKAAGVITTANAGVIIAAINAGATAVAIIAIVGGGGIVAYLIRKAFQNAGKAVIIAA